MNENENKLQPDRGLDDKKKNALLRYLGIMFIVAFLLVLSSLVTKLRSSEAVISQLNQSSTSALQNAEQLQDHNRQLETDNAYLEGRIAELEKQIEDLELELAFSEEDVRNQKELLKENEALIARQQERTQRVHKAYELLLQAAEDPGVLPELEQYADCFDTFAQIYYENLTKEGE